MKILVIFMISLCTLGRLAYASMEQAVMAFDKGDYQQARHLLQQVSNENSRKYLYLARIALADDSIDDATLNIEKAITLDPKHAHSHFTYAEIMAKCAEEASIFSIKGYVKKVKKGFETAVALAPENIRFRQALIKFHVNAPSLLGGDTDEALKHALVLKDHDALYGAGALIHVYGETKNKKAFRQWLNETLLEFKKEPEIHYQAGMYYQNEEIYEIAISYFRAAAEIVEVSEQQHQAKYLAMFQIGRTSMLTERNLDEGEKALVQYMSEAKITSAMPSLAWAKFRLANIVEAKGKKQKAIDIYRQVLHSKSTEYVKMLAQERLKSLGQA